MPKRKKSATGKGEPAAVLADGGPSVERASRPVDKFIDAAGTIDGWAPAADVFDRVTSVRTCFPDFNRAVRVGGLPVRRIHTVHGPTHGGKTAFVLGLAKSFVDPGYLCGYVDAEHSLGQEFAEEMVHELRGKRNFLAVRPNNYEETIDKVDQFLEHAAKVREKFPESKSLLVVDSINKLVPKRELSKILKDGAEEVTKGHHGRYRAALNQAWLDQLTPKIARADCALLIIAQEREGEDTTDFFNDSFKVKGGAALLFDASLVMRVSKGSAIFEKQGSEDKSDRKNEAIVGFMHRVRIWKSKVGHMDGRHTDCCFHLSNGKLTRAGFDFGRDALTVGVKLGVVKQAGAWYSYKGRRQQGINAAIQHLEKNPHRLTELMNDIGDYLDRKEGRAT